MSAITMTPVVSSSVVAIGHDGNETMAVQFKSGVYYFSPVTAQLFALIAASESIGREVNILKATPDISVRRIKEEIAEPAA